MPRFLRPALGRIVLRQLQSDEQTATGIYLPYGKQTISSMAEVVAISDPYQSAPGDKDDVKHGPLYNMGDIVVIGKYNGVEVTIGRETLLVMNESDILCTVVEVADEPAAS